MKACKICLQELDESLFRKNKAYKDGLDYRCKNCCKISERNNYKKNKERILEQNKKWRIKNRDRIKELNDLRYLTHKDKDNQHRKEYYYKNQEKARKYRKRRLLLYPEEVRKLGREGGQRYRDKMKSNLEYKLKNLISSEIRNSSKSSKNGASWRFSFRIRILN